MKRGKLGRLKPSAIVAVGIVLGRGAQADTIITFDGLSANNTPITAPFGSNVSASGPGVSVVGFGTPGISLDWFGTGGSTRWEYYNDAVWSAGQLNGSTNGTSHNILFTPTASVAVSLESLNFHPYYVSAETFSYNWSVIEISPSSTSNVVSSGSINFSSDATKNHPVNINYTGNIGDGLTLRLERIGGTGSGQNIAVDDVRFAQVPEPSTLALLSMGCLAGIAARARWRYARKNQPS